MLNSKIMRRESYVCESIKNIKASLRFHYGRVQFVLEPLSNEFSLFSLSAIRTASDSLVFSTLVIHRRSFLFCCCRTESTGISHAHLFTHSFVLSPFHIICKMMGLLEDFWFNDLSFNETRGDDSDLINYNKNVPEEPFFMLSLLQYPNNFVTAIITIIIVILQIAFWFVVIRQLIIFIVRIRQMVHEERDALEQENEDAEGEYEEQGDQEEREEEQEDFPVIDAFQ